jgi:hypothetical protein
MSFRMIARPFLAALVHRARCSTFFSLCPSGLLRRSNPCPALRAHLPAFRGGGGGFGDESFPPLYCGSGSTIQQRSNLLKPGNLCINIPNNLSFVHAKDYIVSPKRRTAHE